LITLSNQFAQQSIKNPLCINKSSMIEIHTKRTDGKGNFQLSNITGKQAQALSRVSLE